MQLQSLLGFLGKSFSSQDGNAAETAAAEGCQSGFGAMLAAAFGLRPQDGSESVSETSLAQGGSSGPDASADQEADVDFLGERAPSDQKPATTPPSHPAAATSGRETITGQHPARPATSTTSESTGEDGATTAHSASTANMHPASSPPSAAAAGDEGPNHENRIAAQDIHSQNESPSKPAPAGSGPAGMKGAGPVTGSPTNAADAPGNASVRQAEGQSSEHPGRLSDQARDSAPLTPKTSEPAQNAPSSDAGSTPEPQTEARPAIDSANKIDSAKNREQHTAPTRGRTAAPEPTAGSSNPEAGRQGGLTESPAETGGNHQTSQTGRPFRASQTGPQTPTSQTAGQTHARTDGSGQMSDIPSTKQTLEAPTGTNTETAPEHAPRRPQGADNAARELPRGERFVVNNGSDSPQTRSKASSGQPSAPPPSDQAMTETDAVSTPGQQAKMDEGQPNAPDEGVAATRAAGQSGTASADEPSRPSASRRENADVGRRDLSMASMTSHEGSSSHAGSGDSGDPSNRNGTASRDQLSEAATTPSQSVDDVPPEELAADFVKQGDETAFTPEQKTAAGSITQLDAGRITPRGRGVGTAAWLRSIMSQTVRGMSLEQGWKTIEVQLDEGQGTMTVKARRSEDGLSISVAFSDPNVRSLAEANAQRLEDALRSEYASNVDLSLTSDDSADTSSNRDSSEPGRPHRLGRLAPETSSEQAAPTVRRTAAAGIRNEWIG